MINERALDVSCIPFTIEKIGGYQRAAYAESNKQMDAVTKAQGEQSDRLTWIGGDLAKAESDFAAKKAAAAPIEADLTTRNTILAHQVNVAITHFETQKCEDAAKTRQLEARLQNALLANRGLEEKIKQMEVEVMRLQGASTTRSFFAPSIADDE